jgi:hypothetical protein
VRLDFAEDSLDHFKNGGRRQIGVGSTDCHETRIAKPRALRSDLRHIAWGAWAPARRIKAQHGCPEREPRWVRASFCRPLRPASISNIYCVLLASDTGGLLAAFLSTLTACRIPQSSDLGRACEFPDNGPGLLRPKLIRRWALALHHRPLMKRECQPAADCAVMSVTNALVESADSLLPYFAVSSTTTDAIGSGACAGI